MQIDSLIARGVISPGAAERLYQNIAQVPRDLSQQPHVGPEMGRGGGRAGASGEKVVAPDYGAESTLPKEGSNVGRMGSWASDLVADEMFPAAGGKYMTPSDQASLLGKLGRELNGRGFKVNTNYANTGSAYMRVSKPGEEGFPQTVVRFSAHAPVASRNDGGAPILRDSRSVFEMRSNEALGPVAHFDLDTGSGPGKLRSDLDQFAQWLESNPQVAKPKPAWPSVEEAIQEFLRQKGQK